MSRRTPTPDDVLKIAQANPDAFVLDNEQNLDKRSPLAAQFEFQWGLLGGPELVREYKFHPARKWRADYAHPLSKVMIELEGGVYHRGRHVRPQGFIDDIDKYNSATMSGWSVLRIATGGVQPAKLEKMIAFIKERME